MSELNETRAEILDSLLDKHLGNKLKWEPREGEDSFQTYVGNFVFHIDRKPMSGRVRYQVWIFDKQGNDLDSFDAASITDFAPDNTNYTDYTNLAKYIYASVRDSFKLERIRPVLKELKSQ